MNTEQTSKNIFTYIIGLFEQSALFIKTEHTRLIWPKKVKRETLNRKYKSLNHFHLSIAKTEFNLSNEWWHIPLCYSSKLTLLIVFTITTQLEENPDGTASNEHSSYK